MDDPTPALRADILARLLLVQSTAGHLPDEVSIVDFVCRGLEMVPGVNRARNVPPSEASATDSERAERYPLQFGGSAYGEVLIRLDDPEAYAPYSPHVQNLLFVIGLMLEERRQRRLAEAYQRDLEQRVAQRTTQLSLEVVERRAAEARAMVERKHAEDYLAISEAIIVELDAAGVIQVINKRGCEVLGYSHAQLVGKNWFDTVIPNAQAPVLRRVFQQVISGATSGVEYFDNAIVTRDGELKHIAWHNVARYSGERIIGTLSSGVDITERKRSEDALAAEKEQLDVTLRSIGDGVMTTDRNGVIVVMNTVAEQLTGWIAPDSIGRPLPEVFVIVDDRTQLPAENLVARVLSRECVVELSDHVQLVGRHGSQRAIAQTAAPIRNHQGEVVGVVLVFRDITEKNRLIEQTQRAERLDAIGVLAGGIAHDFNNLLAGIFGYLCLAREQAVEASPQATALDDALGVFERARDLTRQLLTFSKGGAPVRSAVDLRKLLTDCTRFALSGSNVASQLRFSSELPNVAADASQVWRMIDNLVRNAVQAMPRGGTLTMVGDTVELQVPNRFRLSAGTYVCVSVTDNGPGIPAELLGKIFDPFFTTKEQGTGLGLATAYSVVHRHDGHIEVQSQVGVGTTFQIYLPVVDQRLVPPQAVTQTADHRGVGRALVLDDEPYLCRLFVRYLSRMGYEVTAVHEGRDAILAVDAAIVEGRPYRLALLDLTIPGGIGGKEAIAIIRLKCPKILAIASSGYSDDPIMAYPTDYGFDASLGKPFAIHELAAVLERLSAKPA